MNEPSQHEANRMVRVLNGERLKFTIRIHRASGEIIEFQSANRVKLDWNNEARALWICDQEYGAGPVMPYEPGMVILQEENPK